LNEELKAVGDVAEKILSRIGLDKPIKRTERKSIFKKAATPTK
jgi:hypothetical protein